MKAALYVRVSTDEQASDGYSISAQSRILKDYCKRENIEVYNLYSDEGISGQNENRPQFQEMLKDASKKNFDIILVHKFDRFARKVELSQRIKRQLRESGINVISLTEPIDDSPIGFFQEGIMELLAEWYVKNLSAETKKGHLERAKQGLHNGSVPYGYKVDHSITAKMSPNPEQVKIVQHIFSCYVSLGHGISRIAKTLNDSNIPSAAGGSWCPKYIKMILANQKYIGNIRLGNNVFKGIHEPIIESETFEQAQKIMTDHSSRFTYRGNNSIKYFLLGIIRCRKCGCAVVIRNSGKHKYYVCSANRRHYDKACDNSMTYRTETLESIVLEKIDAILEDESNDYISVNRHKSFSFFRERKAKLENRLKNAKEGYLDGIFNKNEFMQIKEQIENELNELASEDVQISESKNLCKYKSAWEEIKFSNNPVKINELMRKFTDAIYVDKERIDLYLNLSIDQGESYG